MEIGRVDFPHVPCVPYLGGITMGIGVQVLEMVPDVHGRLYEFELPGGRRERALPV